MAATELTITSAKPADQAFAANRNLVAGDKMEVRVNNEPVLIITVGAGFTYKATGKIAGTVEEVET